MRKASGLIRNLLQFGLIDMYSYVMKPKIIALTVALAFSLPFLVQAETVNFPKNDPQFSVTFADGWKAEITKAGIISAQPKGAAYAISIFPVQAKNARDGIQETLKQVEIRFTDVKSSEPVESKTANNITCLEQHFTAKDKGADRVLTIVAFSPNGRTYYALFQAGTPAVDKEYSPATVAIVKSIKAIKSDNSND
jgi:hypothetical protein